MRSLPRPKQVATISSGPRQRASSRESAAPADVDGAEVGAAGEAVTRHRAPRLMWRMLSAEAAFQAGLQTLDAIDLAATLRKRVLTLQSVPVQVRSTLRTAFQAGLQLVADESSADSSMRGWKLFYLAVRMLLHRAPAEARISTGRARAPL